MNAPAIRKVSSPPRQARKDRAKIRRAADPEKRQAVLETTDRQRTRPINLSLWRQVLEALLAELTVYGGYEVAVHLVAAPEMSRLNETFLHHIGSTDVISFDYHAYPFQEDLPDEAREDLADLTLHGEIFISVDDAVEQALLYQTTWQAELVRYAIHGLMHLQGFDDLKSAERYRMKRLESKWLKSMVGRFALDQL